MRSVYSGGNSVLYQVQSQSNSPDQAMQMAAMAYQAGDLDQALYQYLRVLELEPERYEALVWVGRIHRERGNNQLAEMAFTEVLGKAPDNPDALTEMGLLNLSMRKHEQAKAMLLKAVAVDQKRFVKDPANSQTGAAALRVDGKSPLKAYNGLGGVGGSGRQLRRGANLLPPGRTHRSTFGVGAEQPGVFLLHGRAMVRSRTQVQAWGELRRHLQAAVAQLWTAAGSHGAL
ncbi:hypothetical protein PPS11_20708 [Pseudomonas putida S11]|nr:hypothetical protein PPS11_20708 [Pseudomonas putida S11]